MVDKELLSRKIKKLREYIAELEAAGDINWEKYTQDVRSRAFIERYLHLDQTMDPVRFSPGRSEERTVRP